MTFLVFNPITNITFAFDHEVLGFKFTPCLEQLEYQTKYIE